MGSITNGWLKHHLDRKRKARSRPIEVYLNMQDHVQWTNNRSIKATVHAISKEHGIQEVHFTQQEVGEFIRRFGPKPEPPDEAALETLSLMSDRALLAFLERLFISRAKSRS
jgi:hypothetical protein